MLSPLRAWQDIAQEDTTTLAELFVCRRGTHGKELVDLATQSAEELPGAVAAVGTALDRHNSDVCPPGATAAYLMHPRHAGSKFWNTPRWAAVQEEAAHMLARLYKAGRQATNRLLLDSDEDEGESRETAAAASGVGASAVSAAASASLVEAAEAERSAMSDQALIPAETDSSDLVDMFIDQLSSLASEWYVMRSTRAMQPGVRGKATPMTWSTNYGARWPELRWCALRIFGITVHAAGCERVWSVAGNTLSPRCRPTPGP